MILQDPFTPDSCPKKCPWNWSKIQQYIEDSIEVWVWTWPVLSWISQISFQSKTRQYKPPASPFSVRKGAGFYQEKSESIVHQHKILPTYVIGHTLHNHLPTSCPTFQTFLAGSFQYTWDVNNYRDQIREGKQKGESRQERERERNGQQTALTLGPALHKKHALTSQESSPALPAVCSPRRLNGHPVESKE